MSSETLTPDGNTRNIAGAVTDDSNAFIKKLRIDDTTKGLKVLVVGGTGAGTVTSISQGTGIVATPNPIIGTGTIALANTAVTPGAYTNANITVDQQGRIILAANGSGSSGITINTTTITGGTTGQLLYDNAGTVGELTTATYPSLTELSYVKGVTSAIQTQLNAKQSTITFGTGVQTALGVNIGSAGAPVLFNGALGTPSSGTLTNATGLPATSVLSGALVNGMTATTQSANDNSTNLATTAYVDRIISNVVTSGYLEYIASNYTNSTTSFTQIGTFSKTITVVGNTVLLTLGLDMSVTAYQGYIGVKVDSGSIVSVISSNSSTRNRATGHYVFTGLSPGSHTFTIWGETSNTAVLTVYSFANIDMLLQEI
jgi:hypothetical protein